MPRAANFYYRNSTPDIGNALVRAIFGDPEAAAQQAQVRAEMDLRAAQAEQARAQGGYYTSQTEGQNIANQAQTNLPTFLANFIKSQQPVAPQTIDSPGFENFDAPLPTPEPQLDKGVSLAELIGAMGQMNGDKIDPTKIMGTVGAFGGGDEFARRGLIAQGQTPGKDFAITPQRADEISARDAGEDQTQAFGVARINHANDVPVAKIQAGAVRYGADKRLEGTKYTADTGNGGATRGMRNNNPGNLEYGPFARSLGATGSDGRFAIFPTFEAGVTAQERLLSGGSYYGGGRNTINKILARYAPPSENPTGNYAAYVSRVTGIGPDQPLRPEDIPTVAAAMRQFESGGGSGGGKGGGKAPAAAKPPPAPKPPSAANMKKIEQGVDEYFAGYGLKQEPRTRARTIAEVVVEFQKTGNIPAAIDTVIRNRAVRARANKARAAGGGNPPAQASSGGINVHVSNW